jgi:hypothetical protein
LPQASAPALEQRVGQLLGEIAAAAAAMQAGGAPVFSDEAPEFRLVSPLAEGSDRIVARAALAAGWTLECPLPFSRDDYAADFKDPAAQAEFAALLQSAQAVFELDGSRLHPERAYEAAGLMVLRQCDVLIAMWDGKPASGRGGTAEIVQTAIDGDIPVIWIDPADPRPRLVERRPMSPTTTAPDLAAAAPEIDLASLSDLIASLLAAPASVADSRPGALQKLERFFGEDENWRRRFVAYRLLLRLSGAGGVAAPPQRFKARADERWAPFVAVCGAYAKGLPAAARTRLVDAFAWADGLATHYGERHRSASVLNFALAPAAVTLALLGVLPPPNVFHVLKPVAVFAELIVLTVMVVNTAVARMRSAHDRWVSYRDLAERLRLLRLFVLVGATGVKSGGAHGASGGVNQDWEAWYFRAVSREVGLPTARVDAAYLTMTIDALNRCELNDQIGYHRGNAERMRRVHDWLETLGAATLIVTIVVGVAFLAAKLVALAAPAAFGEIVDGPIASLATFLGGVLPALGAACLGLREYGEYHRRANASRSMVDDLTDLRATLEDRSRLTTLASVSNLIELTAATMTAEIGDWGLIFRAKPLALPG